MRGSPLLGVNGALIITHGRAKRRMIEHAVRVGATTAREQRRVALGFRGRTKGTNLFDKGGVLFANGGHHFAHGRAHSFHGVSHRGRRLFRHLLLLLWVLAAQCCGKPQQPFRANGVNVYAGSRCLFRLLHRFSSWEIVGHIHT